MAEKEDVKLCVVVTTPSCEEFFDDAEVFDKEEVVI